MKSSGPLQVDRSRLSVVSERSKRSNENSTGSFGEGGFNADDEHYDLLPLLSKGLVRHQVNAVFLGRAKPPKLRSQFESHVMERQGRAAKLHPHPIVGGPWRWSGFSDTDGSSIGHQNAESLYPALAARSSSTRETTIRSVPENILRMAIEVHHRD
jgi:hypothetical protein